MEIIVQTFASLTNTIFYTVQLEDNQSVKNNNRGRALALLSRNIEIFRSADPNWKGKGRIGVRQ